MPELNASGKVDHDSDDVDKHIAAMGKNAFHKALAGGTSPSEAFDASESALRAAAASLEVPEAEVDKAWAEAKKVFTQARVAGMAPATAFELAMKGAAVASVTIALDGADDTPAEYSPIATPAPQVTPHVDRVTSSETP